MSSVSLRALRKYFTTHAKVTSEPKRGAIDGLNLDIRAGEFFVLLGPSGCGKTTTLRCIAGLEEPSGGEILIDGEAVAQPERGRFLPPEKRNVGMVFQSYALWPHMSVFDNVAYPLRRGSERLSRSELAARVVEALNLVGLHGNAEAYPPDLSGGQQQRVALARAIVARPRLLLFDEPLSNLDAQLRLRLRQDLRRIHEETGQTSIYVTHDQTEALALADRIAVMRHGRIEQLGSAQDIFLNPRTVFVAEFVGYDNLLAGQIIALDAGIATVRLDGWAQPLRGRVLADVTVGQHARLAIRATNLLIGDAASAAGNTFQAHLSSLTYLGERFQGELRVADTRLQASLGLADSQHVRPGDHVWLTAGVDDVLVLAPEEPA
ncbi:ABC transporter ATP-binding protein [Pseudomonas sp. LRF_L74]|uniref:ABC transporter ATP-binding protein n=1 Tax=Pseudomonas sp. LRF_L74 TaxID=3369422 RepID=UPI003F5E27DE